MEIIKNTLSVGATKPFTILHVSDIHLAETDQNDSIERQQFAADRKRSFPDTKHILNFTKEYVKETGYPLFNTGDMLDFITPENLRITQRFAEETNMIFVTGNHEYWHCEKNRFSYDDVYETYAAKNQALAEIQEYFTNDIRFFCQEINGVNLVCVDNTDYQIEADLFEKLKELEEQGKPIILFMHIPLYSKHLGRDQKSSLNAPPQFFENCHPVDVFERTPNELTCQICDYIRKSPLIKCVISGHTHRNAEIIGLDDQDQIVTGCNTLREITIL